MKKTTFLSVLLIFNISAAFAQVETKIQRLNAPYDHFGWSVSIDDMISTTYLMVGVPGKDSGIFPDLGLQYGVAYIYELGVLLQEWEQITFIPSQMEDSELGTSVSISGGIALAGAPFDYQAGEEAGQVYANSVSTNWTLPSYFDNCVGNFSECNFGYSLQMVYNYPMDIPFAIVGAPSVSNGDEDEKGAAYIYTTDDFASFWQEYDILERPDPGNADFFGFSVAMSHGTSYNAIVGAPGDDDNGNNSGSAYLFKNFSNTPEHFTAFDGAPYDYFGYAVATDTSIAIVGAPFDDDNGENSGSVYVFERSGSAWNFSAKITPSDGAAENLFGKALSLYVGGNGSYALIGAPGPIENSKVEGAAYIFKKESGNWVQKGKLTASDGHLGNQYGLSVDMSEVFSVVGAPYAYTPSGGNKSGQVYVYEGTHTGLLSYAPSELYFGNVAVGGSRDMQITLSNLGLEDIQIDSASIVGLNPQYFSVNNAPITLSSGESHVLDVQFSPVVLGSFEAYLKLYSNLGAKSIPLAGNGSGILTFTPEEMNFGELRCGWLLHDTLTLSNVGNNTVTVDSVVVTGDWINFQVQLPVFPFTLSSFENKLIPVTFEPPVEGLYAAEVSAYSVSGNITATLSGEGILAGQISIAADTVYFGTTSPTMEAIDTVYVGNIGIYPIVISEVYYSGPNPDNFGVLTGMLPITLPPGSYIPFPAYFAPDDTIPFFATCHFVSNGGTDQVVFAGNGTSAGFLQVAPAAGDFGEVINGHTVTQELVIGNFGLNDLYVGPITITGSEPDNFSVNTTSFTLEPTYIERLDVSFTPNASTSFSALITIQSDGGTESIALNGYGFSVLPSGETKVTANPDVFMGHVSVSQGHGVASFAQFYRADASSWIEKADFTYPAFGGNGSDVATDGLYAFVGAPYDTVEGVGEAGTVLVYNQSGSSWSLMDKISAFDFSYFDQFGHSLDFDGDHLIVGSIYDDDHGTDMGSAYIMPFHSWGASLGFKIYPADQQIHPSFGLYVAISGDYAIVGRPLDATNGFAAGAVYVFEKNGPGWYQSQKLFASDAGTVKSFGGAVAMDDEYMIIGSPGGGTSGSGGAAYIFHLNAGTWQEEAILTPEHISENFGYAVSISGEYALIGTPDADFTSFEGDAGAAWLFKRDGTNWEEQRMIRPSDAHQDHHFGHAVDIDDDFLSMMIATREGEIYFYGDSAFLGIDDATNRKLEFVLFQNKPNPFNMETSIQFELPQSEYVTLDIYDLFGEMIAAIVDRKLAAGKYDYTWNPKDLAEGLYFCKLTAGKFIATKKMVLMK